MKASIRTILLKHKKLSNGNYPVYLRVTIDRRIKYFGLGSDYNCKLKDWNIKEGLFKDSYKNYSIMNKHIDITIQKARAAAIELDNKGIEFTIEDFSIAFTKKGNTIQLFSYFDEVIEKLKEIDKIGNATVYSDTKNSLKNFLEDKKKIKSADISLNSIDYKFLKEYEDYLGLTCKNNSIHVRMRTIRALYNKAIKEEGFEYYPFKTYTLAHLKTKTAKRALSTKELSKIFKCKAKPGSRKYHSLNYFRFMYYCRGMNFIDISLLKKNEISRDKFVYIRTKTHKEYEIDIFPETRRIINEYKELTINSEYLFPILTDKHDTTEKIKTRVKIALKGLNSDMKDIGKELKISQKVTSYTTRHTFATILKHLGVSTSIISEGLGHDEATTVQIYLGDHDKKTIKDSAKKAINAIKT